MAEIEILSGESQLATKAFSDEENKKFEDAFKQVTRFYNRTGRIILFDDEVKAGIKYLATAYKARKDLTFEGIFPQGGYGMRPIIVRDVTGLDVTSTEWDIAWGTAGIRSWLFNHAAGAAAPIGGALATDAYGAHNDIVPRDANNDEWALAIVGIASYHPSPRVKMVRVSLNKEVYGDLIVEPYFRNSEQAFCDSGKIMYMAPGKPFSMGVEVRTIGNDAIYPVGVTFGSANRFRQNAAVMPNRCLTA